jgi:hypothetical protein
VGSRKLRKVLESDLSEQGCVENMFLAQWEATQSPAARGTGLRLEGAADASVPCVQASFIFATDWALGVSSFQYRPTVNCCLHRHPSSPEESLFHVF